MKVFEIDSQLDRQPAIAGALVDVHLHLEELVEDLCGLAEDCVVQGAPAFFTELVYYIRFFLLDLEQDLFLNVLRVVLKHI